MGIVVVGAGAIGLLVAGRLTRSAERVALLARPGTAAALASQGIAICTGEKVERCSLPVLGAPDELLPADHPPDLAILCVKGYDTVEALSTLEALAPRLILTLQNGIGNEETLAGRFGRGRVLSGAITTVVEVAGPGQITVAKEGGIGLAPLTPGVAVDRWARALEVAGFAVERYADYRALKWSKALLNMLGNATAAILDMPVAEVYADPRLLALERQAFGEALQVMDRMGVRPVNLPRYPAAYLALAMRRLPAWLLDPLLRRVVAGGRGSKPPSLQLDLARGSRRSEGEFLNGAVAQAAARLGIAAPANQLIWETLHAIVAGEVAWEAYRRRPERLLGSARWR